MSRASLTRVIGNHIQRALLKLHTSLPGVVKSYDASTQTAEVQPLIRMLASLPDAVKQLIELPPIPNVPVVWPGGGGLGLHVPMSSGDNVLLVFCEHSIERWQASGGANPVDAGSYDKGPLAGAVAIPLLRTASQAWSGLSSGGNIRLGADSGSFDAPAKAALVEADLQSIVDAIDNATVTPMDGGAALQTAIVTALSAAGVPNSLGADDVEVS